VSAFNPPTPSLSFSPRKREAGLAVSISKRTIRVCWRLGVKRLKTQKNSRLLPETDARTPHEKKDTTRQRLGGERKRFNVGATRRSLATLFTRTTQDTATPQETPKKGKIKKPRRKNNLGHRFERKKTYQKTKSQHP
jgi:hypothetical protein